MFGGLLILTIPSSWLPPVIKNLTTGKHVHEKNTPLNPNLYRNMGFAGVYLFLLQNIDCEYSLEQPRRERKGLVI